MQDVGAAIDGGGPAGVGDEVGLDHLEPVTGIDSASDDGAQRRLLGQTAHGGAHREALLEGPNDAPARDEAAPSGDQNSLRHDHDLPVD